MKALAEASAPLGYRIYFFFVAFIRNVFEKCVEFVRAFHGAINVDVDARVLIIAPIATNPGANALLQRISIRATTLQLIANTSIEIVALSGFAPEGEMTPGKKVIYQFATDP